MSAPKLLRILDAAAQRMTVVSQAGGYYTDIGREVRRDNREPDADDVPLSLVFLGERATAESKGRSSRCNQAITVMGYHKLSHSDRPEEVGVYLLADIQRAMEGYDEALAKLLLKSHHGLTFQSDEISTPEVGSNVIGARVTYAIPHIRDVV